MENIYDEGSGVEKERVIEGAHYHEKMFDRIPL